MKLGDKVLMRHYIPVHGYMFDIVEINSPDILQYIMDHSDSVVLVANEYGSFGKTIDALFKED